MLHMLTLLKDLLPCFPEGLVKSCSETLLRVMTLNHVVSSCPSAWGNLRRREGRASDPGLRAGTREAHCSGQKRELGSPGPDPALGYTRRPISSLVWGRRGSLSWEMSSGRGWNRVGLVKQQSSPA